MLKTMLSIVAILAFASCAFAQPLPLDEQVRTSTVVPDLHNPASGWKVVPENERLQYQNEALTIKVTEEYYENTKDHMMAFLYVREANGKREELSMLYGTDNVARGAIKSEGAWHVSKEMYYENGKQNPKGNVSLEVIPDKKEPAKPAKAKLFLETVDGPKEITIDLQ